VVGESEDDSKLKAALEIPKSLVAKFIATGPLS